MEGIEMCVAPAIWLLLLLSRLFEMRNKDFVSATQTYSQIQISDIFLILESFPKEYNTCASYDIGNIELCVWRGMIISVHDNTKRKIGL